MKGVDKLIDFIIRVKKECPLEYDLIQDKKLCTDKTCAECWRQSLEKEYEEE